MSAEAIQRSLISTNTAIRLGVLAFVLMASQLGAKTFGLIVLTTGFAHYLLALLYSRRRVKQIGSDVKAVPRFVFVTLVGVVLATLQFPIAWASLIHHNFNEVYVRDAFQARPSDTKMLRVSCVIFNCFIFAAILRMAPAFRQMNQQLLLAGVAVSGLWYLNRLVDGKNRGFTIRQFIDNSVYEIVGLGLLALSHSYRVTLSHLFLYHFVFWTFYPAPNIVKKGGNINAYALLNALLLTVIWLALSNVREIPSLQTIGWLFGWLGVVHILMSLALSNEQPTWIVRFFQAATRPAAALSPEQQALPHALPAAAGQRH